MADSPAKGTGGVHVLKHIAGLPPRAIKDSKDVNAGIKSPISNHNLVRIKDTLHEEAHFIMFHIIEHGKKPIPNLGKDPHSANVDGRGANVSLPITVNVIAPKDDNPTTPCHVVNGVVIPLLATPLNGCEHVTKSGVIA